MLPGAFHTVHPYSCEAEAYDGTELPADASVRESPLSFLFPCNHGSANPFVRKQQLYNCLTISGLAISLRPTLGSMASTSEQQHDRHRVTVGLPDREQLWPF